MEYRIAHISDLHISRPIEDCIRFLNKNIQPLQKDIDKIVTEITELDEQKLRLLVRQPKQPQRPQLPIPVLIHPGFGFGRFGVVGGGGYILSGESSYFMRMKQYEKKMEAWKEFAKMHDVSIKQWELNVQELAGLIDTKTNHLNQLKQQVKQETEKLQDSLYDKVRRYYYKDVFPMDRFVPLKKSLHEWKVNHLIVTGDITNLSQQFEYQDFLNELAEWVEKKQISVIPGNHDTEFFGSSIQFIDGLGALIPDKYPNFIERNKTAPFPYVKELSDKIILIALDSRTNIDELNLLDSFVTNSRGNLSDEQFNELEALLADHSMRNRIVIVAIHHHLLDIPSYAPWKDPYFMGRMTGAERLLLMLKKYNVRIILNGHLHYPLHILASRDWPEILTADSLSCPYDGIPKYQLLSIADGHLNLSTIKIESDELHV